MRIILAAREADLRLASQLLLTEEPNVDVVGTASTVSGTLALLKTYRVDIIILDSELSSRESSEWIAKIKNTKSKPKILLLVPEDIHSEKVSEMWVDAFVNKTEPPDRLITVFRRLVAEIKLEASKEKENIKS